MARTWGFWTRNKLDILSAYLPAFTMASSRRARGTAVASELENELALRHPGRDDYRVVPGDSNDTIDGVLSELRETRLDWAPTFAFLDPRNLGAKWTTIEKLADFKRHRRNKIGHLCIT